MENLIYKDKQNYRIYCHITPSGKRYIGYTCQDRIQDRWRKNGQGYCNNPLFWAAIKKYGWENIQHLTLKENLSFEEANNWEKYYINLFKSDQRKFGYNLTPGGSNPNMTPEAKEKIRQKKQGSHYYKPGMLIYQYSQDGQLITTFKSYYDAQEATGINLYRIASGCNHGGTTDKFKFSKVPLTIDQVQTLFRHSTAKKDIYHYNSNGKLIAIYNGYEEAVEKTGIKKDTLCCAASLSSGPRSNKEFPYGNFFSLYPLTDEEIEDKKKRLQEKLEKSKGKIKIKEFKINGQN